VSGEANAHTRYAGYWRACVGFPQSNEWTTRGVGGWPVPAGTLDPSASLKPPTQYRLLPAGDTALVVEFGERIDRRLSAQVLTLARLLGELRDEGVIDTISKPA